MSRVYKVAQKELVHSRQIITYSIAGIAALLWVVVFHVFVLPLLWGPYSHILINADMTLLSRVGAFLTGLMPPVMLISLTRALRSDSPRKLLSLAYGLAIFFMCVLGLGYQVHHTVAIQGVDNSIRIFAAEVGFNSSEEVPSHIKEALRLSARLADEGKAPWMPGEWKDVNWPVIPAPNR